jgi:hypothetical protein
MRRSTAPSAARANSAPVSSPVPARAFSATSSSRSPTPRPWSTAGARRAPAADVEQPRGRRPGRRIGNEVADVVPPRFIVLYMATWRPTLLLLEQRMVHAMR